MSKPRIARVAKARIGYFAGLLHIAAGIGWALAPGWGLTAFGAGLIAWFVLLYDIDEEPPVQEDGPW